MLLKGKNAVIYGAGGSIAGAVARAFAREGATVFLTGHHEESVLATARDIIAKGGMAETAVVDALDKAAVNAHLEAVARQAGTVDISFNAIDVKDVQGIPLIEMEPEDFLQPINIMMKSQFITATAAGTQMVKQGKGVILSITATPAGMAYPLVGGFGPSCSALEGFSRNLASELGPQGVRVMCIRSAGSPDSKPFIEALKTDPVGTGQVLKGMVDDTMLKKMPLMNEIGNVAVLLASDLSSPLTGTAINATCGTCRD